MNSTEHVMRRMMLLSLAGHVVLFVVAIASNWITATAVRPGRAAFGPTVSYVHLVNLPPAPTIATPAPPANRSPRAIAPLPVPRPVAPAKTAVLSLPAPRSLQDWWRRQMARVPMPPQPLVTPRPQSDKSETESRSAVPAMTAVASVEGPAFPFPSYLTAIQEKVAGHWAPPRLGLSGGDGRQVVVGFVLGQTGQVNRLAVEHGSGEAAQDEAALRAVRLAQPFPPLPEALRQSSLQVHFRFTLRSGLAAGE